MTKSLDCASCSHLPGCMPCAVLQACSFTIQIAMVLFSRVTIEWGVCRYSRLALDPWPRSQCARLCGCSSPSFSARPSHNTIISHRQRGALQKSMLNGFGEDTAQLGCKNIADLCARHLHLSLIDQPRRSSTCAGAAAERSCPPAAKRRIAPAARLWLAASHRTR